ncbi:MAG TPA: stimulus-sensing domain-containing protein, partial [Alphaproteobacteria bacterium]|nr:stimulus-sensing domain-containing protein [Alphaproteobacteria bacterium]
MARGLRARRWWRRASGGSVRRRLRGVRRRFTGLTIRIFGVNVIPLLILWVGILYLGQYKESLIRAELETLKAQAQLFAGAIAEGAVRPVPTLVRETPDPRLYGPVVPREPEEVEALAPDLSRRMVRRLGETTESRTRLFDTQAGMIGDSFQLVGPGGIVQVTSLKAPPDDRFDFSDLIDWGGEVMGRFVPLTIDLPPYPVCQDKKARTCPDVTRGLDGRVSASAWKDPDGGILLSAAAPVQKIKQVIGVVLLTKDGQDIEDAMVKVRKDFLRVFLGALLLTFLLSLYL